jgi:YNFM family putative membrane transporter
VVDSRTIIFSTLSLDMLLWGLVNSLFGPSSLNIMSSFNVDFAEAGVVVSAACFGAMFSIFTGRYADKFGSYYMTRYSLFFLGLTTLLAGFSNSIFLFIAMSFLTGISIGTFQASSSQVILELYPEAKLKMLGVNQAFFGIGATIGPTLTAVLVSDFNSWKVAYMLFGGLLTAFMAFQLLIIKQPRTQSVTLSEEKKSVKDNTFYVLFIALFFMFIAGQGIASWLPTYVVTSNKATYLEASALLSCYWGVGTVMRGFGWKIVDKTGEKKALVYFMLVFSICTLISIGVAGFLPNALIWGIVGLVYVPIYPLVMAVTYSKYRRNLGRVIGRLVAFGNFGALIAAPLIGTINNVSGPNIATLVIPISGLIVLMMFLKLNID